MKLDVIYEDNHLLVVNKPAGLLTQPSGTENPNLEEAAKKWVKEKYHKPGQVFLSAVHRLDKPVSGIVLFARTSKALSRLNVSMREKSAKKVYWALVEKAPKEEIGTLEHYHSHDEFFAVVSDKPHSSAKKAILHYKLLKRESYGTLLEITLETGRYHQIRAQLAAIGCPILGDKKYGSKIALEDPDVIALHHRRLEIPHPISNQLMVFEAPVPPCFLKSSGIGGRACNIASNAV